MKRLLLIIILQNFVTGSMLSQSFSVNDLVKVASLPSKDIDHFMNKNGYVLASSKSENEAMEASFSIKIKKNKIYTGPKRTINIYLKDDSKYFILHTSSLNEYLDGRRCLIKSGFFHDDKKDVNKDSSVLFQKGNITIQATMENRDSVPQYTFE